MAQTCSNWLRESRTGPIGAHAQVEGHTSLTRERESAGDSRKIGCTARASGEAVYRSTYVMPPRQEVSLRVRF